MTSSKKHDENVDQTQFGVNAKEDGALNLGKRTNIISEVFPSIREHVVIQS